VLHIWGTGKPGHAVTVSFGGREATGLVTAVGHWRVQLKPLDVSAEGRSLTVVSEEESIRIDDILVGEVWFGTGQSNMVMPVRGSDTAEKALKQAEEYPLIRLLQVKQMKAAGQRHTVELETGGWEQARGHALAGFSATAYYFGRAVSRETGVPVGLIQSCVGGTPIQSWMPEITLNETEAGMDYRANWRQQIAELVALRPNQDGFEEMLLMRREPSGLYNAMIHGLAPYSARGFIWYQGEGNARDPGGYLEMFPRMVRSWRGRWADPFLEFYWVQLAGYRQEDWPAFRQTQYELLDIVPHGGMASAIDVGDPDDIHPKNKAEVGERLASIALHRVYGKVSFADHHSPLPARLRAKGTEIEITFSPVGDGLETSDGAMARTFEVKTDKKGFMPVRARITGPATIRLSGYSGIALAVRYGWAANPKVNLINSAGLPVTPFAQELGPYPGDAELED